MTRVLADHQAERALIGAFMLSPPVLSRLLGETGLSPQDFHHEAHAAIYTAAATVHDRGHRPDAITIAAQLEDTPWPQTPAGLELFTADAMDAASWPGHAERIQDLARRRKVKHASLLLAQAADTGDEGPLREAEELLAAPAGDSAQATYGPEELQSRFLDRMLRPAEQRMKLPFAELDMWTGGGLRPKQVVLIGGWTSNGKSVLYDQILDHLAGQGLRVHSYINEMSEEERTDRTMSRLSGVHFRKIHSRDLTDEQARKVRDAAGKIRVGMTECAGWTAPEIARHIRFNGWDVAGVDILHEIAHREERDLAEIAQTLRAAAKQAGCVLICCVHLNDNRVSSPQRPAPVLRDVRGSGMLVRGADVVLLVHRDDDQDGIPTNDGMLFAAKIRNGQPSAMRLAFRPGEMRFLPRAHLEAVA